ncbi:MAG: SUMF1/EgtB/PvdO family nonheme iron enzyme, partial [Bacteroidales bacterium]|nr:SUMF1/EgtB/PvdO family nonheme iron enzyme [Bacteroidales bacterium]
MAIPEIESLPYQTELASMFRAYKLAEEAEKYIAGDPKLNEIFSKYSIRLSVKTTPPGASIYYKDFSAPEEDWEFVGISPIEDMRFPGGFFRWKIEKNDYETIEVASMNFSDDIESLAPRRLEWILDRKGTIPEGMVRAPGSQTAIGVLPFLFFDKYEVTNKQFREFLNSGGYRNREYWKHKFLKEGRELQWEEAIAEFVDASGRPGPSTWQAGDYPDGKDNYPVSGVSWYEAAAYAQWAGKDLPTVFHWDAAFRKEIIENFFYLPSIIAAFSNFGEGPVRVGSTHSLSFSGCFDLAGNVREWCWNDSPVGRIILGGAWNDVSYMSTNRSQMPAFNRSPKNGFRCAVYPDRNSLSEQIFQPVPVWGNSRDYRFEEPVSETEFQFYRNQFLYDKTDLNSQIEKRDESPEDWIMEKISFDAAYENERMIAYLFLPKGSVPPFQTVIFFPGGGALHQTSITEGISPKLHIDYILKNGRAVMFPIYKGTYERKGGSCDRSHPGESHQYTECLVKRVKDLSRSIDYLETREDID